MDHFAGALAVTAAVTCLAACGDPLVVTGDAPGVMRIVAGIPEEPGDSLGESATESLLDEPHGVTAGPDGTLYIADRQNSRVVAVKPNGKLGVLLDHSERRQEPRLHTPVGLAIDGDEELLVADPEGHQVWRIDLATREPAPIAGTGGGAETDTTVALGTDLRGPSGVAVAPDGAIYVTELLGHRVRRIDPDGDIATVVGTGSPDFGGDGGPAVDAALNRPVGLAFAGGVLYIADSGNQRVRAFDLNNLTIETVAGSGIAGFGGDGGQAIDALLNDPAAVAATGDGRRLFIADSGNHRIRVVDLDTGTIFTFAGTGEVEYAGDLLTAGETSLNAPQGLTASAFNVLFISDTGHHIVYRTALGALQTP